MTTPTMRFRPFASIRLRPLAMLLIVWLAVVAIVVVLLGEGRRAAIERTERASAGLASLVEELTASRLQAVQLTLRAIANAYERPPRPRRNDPAFQVLMESRLRDLPFVRAIFIIGPDGWLIHDTDYPFTPNLSLADRDYFRAHAADAGLTSAVSPPVESRSGTGWFLAVTERLGSGPAFNGVLVAAVQVSEFQALFRRMDLVHGDGIGLIHRSGELVSRYPEAAKGHAVGDSLAHLAPFPTHLRERPSGILTSEGGLFPAGETIAYRALDRIPFVAMAAKPSYLAEWRRTAMWAGLAMTALTLMLVFFVRSLVVDRRRRELARQRRAQAEKLEALGQLTGGMAHDFGNLLQVVSASLQIVALRPLDPERVDSALSTAQRATLRGAKLVERLLSFARRQPMSPKGIDLARFLADAEDLLAQAAGPGVRVSTEVAGGLPCVMADETQLEVALVNLVVNARDAMSGAGAIRLVAYACTDDEPSPARAKNAAVCLSVCDTGPGMSADVLRRAIEPFFTTKGEHGTGLGLAQVYGCMRQMGGDLRIESKPGEGTQVHLYFAPAQPGPTEPIRVRSGPLLARCARCDGSDFARVNGNGPLGPTSIVRCVQCAQEARYGYLQARVTREAAATSAAWLLRWRRNLKARGLRTWIP